MSTSDMSAFMYFKVTSDATIYLKRIAAKDGLRPNKALQDELRPNIALQRLLKGVLVVFIYIYMRFILYQIYNQNTEAHNLVIRYALPSEDRLIRLESLSVRLIFVGIFF